MKKIFSKIWKQLKAGLRAGDRIIEINGVNIENENAEDVFYRIKACHNMVTLLAVDAKTFGLIRKNRLSLDKMKAELGFSGYKDWVGRKQKQHVDEAGNKVEGSVQNQFQLTRCRYGRCAVMRL